MAISVWTFPILFSAIVISSALYRSYPAASDDIRVGSVAVGDYFVTTNLLSCGNVG
jgi:hypothetical protein